MKYIDIRGKLNRHDKYIEVLNKLEPITKHIEVVGIELTGNELKKELENNIIEIKKVKEWSGTLTDRKVPLYIIKPTEKIFSILRGYSTFCKYFISRLGDYSEETELGQMDIAFFDEKKEPLLFTTSHEGYITIRKDIA